MKLNGVPIGPEMPNYRFELDSISYSKPVGHLKKEQYLLENPKDSDFVFLSCACTENCPPP